MTVRRFVCFFLLACVLWPLGASAEVVTRVIDGDTLVLDDGRHVRLVGIQAPEMRYDRKTGVPNPEPGAVASTQALRTLAEGKTVTIELAGQPQDRYGRVLAHVIRQDGTWLQGAMLSQGHARVYTFADNRAFAGDLLALEAEARRAGLGLWQLADYKVRPAQDTLPTRGFFIVEGRVQDVARVRDRIYLNFGDNWRTDFTVRINQDAWALFEQANLDPLALTGKMVRVRGWMIAQNGPMIILDHPERLEVLSGNE